MKLYSHKLISNARKLRKNQTPGETVLWSKLKNKQLLGYKFRRQVPIDPYVVDFFCKELKLIIEIDGSTHDEAKFDYDQRRQRYLENDYKVMRFSEYDSERNLDDILQSIVNYINELKY